MVISELIELLNKHGIDINSDGENLKLQSDKEIDVYILNLIKEYKNELIAHCHKNAVSIIKKQEPRDSGYLLSPAQNKLWILSQFENIGSAYNMPWIFKWMSSLDIPKFVAAYHRIIQKHESLRTTFDIDESAHLRQFVKPFNADLFQVEIVDFEKNKLTNTNVVSSTVNTFISLLFDLQKLSLIRLQILKHSDNEYTFVFSLHHIIADGRSIQILQNDLLINKVLFLY